MLKCFENVDILIYFDVFKDNLRLYKTLAHDKEY